MNESPAPPLVTPEPAREHLPRTPEEKAQWVERFLASGLSLRKFSQEHDLPRMSLWRWVKEARATSAADGSGANCATTRFAELKLPTALGRSDWAVELTLPNGTILRLSKDVPSAVVDQLLRLC
jgi:transposase-like protein